MNRFSAKISPEEEEKSREKIKKSNGQPMPHLVFLLIFHMLCGIHILTEHLLGH
jgi:hypothetical protein